uniref:ACPII-1 n=1 Tax=Chroomonas placoidea TaxID=173977 RepID=UPI0032B08E3F
KMLRLSILAACLAAAQAFTSPAALLRPSTRAAVSRGPSMQLYKDGIIQGLGVEAIPGAGRPANLDGTLVGDVGFDPLGFSNWLDLRWAREAEIKHGRVAMLAATGMIVQDAYKFPGFEGEFGGAAMMKLHNLAVEQGAMQQLLLWLGLLEIISGVPAIIQTLNGSERQPGDFGFDPLNCGANPDTLARRQLTELKNGRLAMIAVGGMVHHYLLVGRGPIEFITNIPNFKNPLPPF